MTINNAQSNELLKNDLLCCTAAFYEVPAGDIAAACGGVNQDEYVLVNYLKKTWPHYYSLWKNDNLFHRQVVALCYFLKVKSQVNPVLINDTMEPVSWTKVLDFMNQCEDGSEFAFYSIGFDIYNLPSAHWTHAVRTTAGITFTDYQVDTPGGNGAKKSIHPMARGGQPFDLTFPLSLFYAIKVKTAYEKLNLFQGNSNGEDEEEKE